MSRRTSTLISSTSCVEALAEALLRYGKLRIFNTDQGAQFTSAACTLDEPERLEPAVKFVSVSEAVIEAERLAATDEYLGAVVIEVFEDEGAGFPEEAGKMDVSTISLREVKSSAPVKLLLQTQQFRRIATRYGKTDQSFWAMIDRPRPQ